MKETKLAKKIGVAKYLGIEGGGLMRKWGVIFLLPLLLIMFPNCASLEKILSKAAAPYAIYDTQIVERDFVGLEFSFANLSGKEIQSVNFFTRISTSGDGSFDSDFADDAIEKEFCFATSMSGGDVEQFFIPFDEFSFEGDLENYFVESLYANEIVFEDGTVWQDSGGGTVL